MKISVDKNLFVKSLSHVQSIVEKRHSVPILANVMIEAEKEIILSTTDRDLFVTEKIEANIEEPGKITLPVHTLFEIIKKIPDGAVVNLSCDEGDDSLRVYIDAESVKCTLPGISPEEFPNFTFNQEHTATFSIHSDALHKLLYITRYAISLEETRYYLNGVYLHISINGDAEVLRAVATDGHRLVISEVELPDGATGMPGIIIPKKAVNELIKLLDEDEGEAKVLVSRSKFTAHIGNTTLTSKLIDGKFPDYSKAMPTQNDKKLEVETKKLANAIDLVTTISSDKTRAVKMSIENSSIALSTSSTANGGSDANQQIEASFEHEPMKVAFNGKYVLDILTILEGQVASFLFSNEGSAVVVQNPNDSSSSHILMPMQV